LTGFRESEKGSLAVIGRLLVAAIRTYQLLLRPVMPPACRFHPTCSEYAIRALRERGPMRGSVLAARRLLRCHPWNPGGYDPLDVPGSEAASRAAMRSGH
jgi:putative membrane protein insertion efficiency factor